MVLVALLVKLRVWSKDALPSGSAFEGRLLRLTRPIVAPTDQPVNVCLSGLWTRQYCELLLALVLLLSPAALGTALRYVSRQRCRQQLLLRAASCQLATFDSIRRGYVVCGPSVTVADRLSVGPSTVLRTFPLTVSPLRDNANCRRLNHLHRFAAAAAPPAASASRQSTV